MQLIRTLRYIVNHPFNKERRLEATWRFIRWQISSRVASNPVIHQFTRNSKIWAWNGLSGVTGNIYCGLHEYEDMAFVLHLLRKGDLFVDVGANVGSYTILAAAEVGAHCISVEPVPDTFNFLCKNIQLNEISGRVEAFNMGLGRQNGIINFTAGLDTVNHVATAEESNTIAVPVTTLDQLLSGKNPIFIKIDVEGYETEVLAGAMETLQNSSLLGLILELNGSGARYGFDERNIHKDLIALGFLPHRYEPAEKKIHPLEGYGRHNTLYLRNTEEINKRLHTAELRWVQGYPV